MNLKPLGDRIVVKPEEEAESRTASGLVIPDTAKEKPQEAEVVAVGPGKIQDSGERLVAVGSRRHPAPHGCGPGGIIAVAHNMVHMQLRHHVAQCGDIELVGLKGPLERGPERVLRGHRNLDHRHTGGQLEIVEYIQLSLFRNHRGETLVVESPHGQYPALLE